MAAVMQLADPRETKTKPLPTFVARSVDLAEEKQLGPLVKQISLMKAELTTLREDLARAQRTILQRDILLRNARVREMTLRAGM